MPIHTRKQNSQYQALKSFQFQSKRAFYRMPARRKMFLIWKKTSSKNTTISKSPYLP